MKKLIQHVLAFFLRFILVFRYRIKFEGLDRLNSQSLSKPGGVLFLPNHPTVFIDPTIVTLAVYRKFPIRPMVVEYMYYKPIVYRSMKLLNALPIPSFSGGSNSLKRKKGEEVIQTVIRDLRKGDNFLIYPGGRLKQTSIEEVGANSAVHRIIQEVPETNIVLVRIKGLWGSSFSRALSGKTPPMLSTIFKGAFAVLKNLIFFTPRREVVVEFVPAPADFPYQAPRLEFNRYLEEWYNQPDGLSDQKKGDSLILVSYSRWREELPKLHIPEATQEEKINLSKIPEDVKENVLKELARISRMDKKQIQPNMMLSTDLGLDSLDTAEFVAYLNSYFETGSVPVHELTTVGKAFAVAGKQITYHEDEEEQSAQFDMKKWFQKPVNPKRCKIAEGETIPEVFLNNCKRMGSAVACGDLRSGILTYPQVKTRTILLAEYVKTLPGEYIGILLPASVPAYLLVLACQLAGKIPLMVNWTIGPRHLEMVKELSKVQVILSSWAFIDRLDNVEFNGIEDQLVMLEDVKEKLGLGKKLKALFLSKRGTKSLLKHFGIDKKTKSDIAALLFTSGTESMPKGVPLSHDNLLSNQRDALETVELLTSDCMFGFLPPFHVFGLSFGGLLGFTGGIKIAFYPDPTNGKQLIDNFEKWGVTLFCSAPTFVKNMLKNAKPEQLKNLRLCITGAERLPKELIDKFEDLGKIFALTEGYGITECGPVLTLVRPGEELIGVGRPMPSVEIRIVHEETFELLPIGERGMIIAKGPNIFSGYLNPGLKSPFTKLNEENWYVTGDLGYLDEKNRLTISGRKKRFVKIGGEMVSLAAIEHALLHEASRREWLVDLEGPSLAVCSKEEGGEKPRIFLFTKFQTSAEEANEALKASGFSNLVKVASVIDVPEIPIMGSGKINYRQLESEYLVEPEKKTKECSLP